MPHLTLEQKFGNIFKFLGHISRGQKLKILTASQEFNGGCEKGIVGKK
jgi:hypothetical protein